MSRLPLSCCYIIKNEEEFIEQSLMSVAPFVDELILCDSGSTDRTKEIAFSFQKNVPHFQWLDREWNDNFADARNFVASKARYNWILFVDGDEWLDSSAFTNIQRAIGQDKTLCFSLTQRNYTLNQETEMARELTTEVVEELPLPIRNRSEKIFFIENWMERLYRRDFGIAYEGPIHESLLPSVSRLGLSHERLPVILHHFGRLKKDIGDKYFYYLELTRKKLKEQPENPAAWVEICMTLLELKEFDSAFDFAVRATAKFRDQPEIFKVSFQAALRKDQWQIAENWIRHYLSFYPGDAYSMSQLTTALLYQGKFRDVISISQEVLKADPENFVVHVNCATIFFEMKDWKSASRHISTGLRLRPKDKFLNDALSKLPTEFQIR